MSHTWMPFTVQLVGSVEQTLGCSISRTDRQFSRFMREWTAAANYNKVHYPPSGGRRGCTHAPFSTGLFALQSDLFVPSTCHFGSFSNDRRRLDRALWLPCSRRPLTSPDFLGCRNGLCDSDVKRCKVDTARSLATIRTPVLGVAEQVMSFCCPDFNEAFAFVQSLRSGIHFVNLE